MLWMTVVSFHRNLNKYSLAIVSLALAVLVSCLGLSGLQLLQAAVVKPLSFIGAGKVLIMDERTKLTTMQGMVYADPLDIKPFPAALAEQVVAGARIEAAVEQTLIAPVKNYGNSQMPWFYLAARSSPERSLSSLQLDAGDLSDLQQDQPVPVLLMRGYGGRNAIGPISWDKANVGAPRGQTIPPIGTVGGQYDWAVPQALTHTYQVKGIYDATTVLYAVNWTNMDRLRSQVGGDRPISLFGVDCSLQQMPEVKLQLEGEIAKLGLPLKVMTVYDLGRMLIGDFDRLEEMADYYAPVMLFVAVLIVLVNAIALTVARRKELALLRTLGFSLGQIQAMFIFECLITAICGGAIGTLLASLVSFSQSGGMSANGLPFLITVAATVIVGSATTLILTSGSLSRTLRNPLE